MERSPYRTARWSTGFGSLRSLQCEIEEPTQRRCRVATTPDDSSFEKRSVLRQLHVAHACAREVSQRGGNKRDAHAGGDEADDRLHLDGLLGDARAASMGRVIA